MICGARQVGKTTLLKKIAEDNKTINYITLDYPRIRQLAKEDPELFLKQYSDPLIIDEIQYAPELLPFIKIKVDEKL
jgi:predicted AAA+ superfamily ATPase